MVLLLNDAPTHLIDECQWPWPKTSVEITEPVRHRLSPDWKRPLDLVLAVLLLLLSAPVLLLAAVIVKVTSRGPVFYTQKRVGQNGVIYNIYKIRTMFHDC